MILLIMAVATLAIFLVMGGLLFAAGISERRQHPETPKGSASERKAA